jgi:hypothetical protein
MPDAFLQRVMAQCDAERSDRLEKLRGREVRVNRQPCRVCGKQIRFREETSQHRRVRCLCWRCWASSIRNKKRGRPTKLPSPRVLAAMPAGTFISPSELARKLSTYSALVSSRLTWLMTKGEVERVAKGLYRRAS